MIRDAVAESLPPAYSTVVTRSQRKSSLRLENPEIPEAPRRPLAKKDKRGHPEPDAQRIEPFANVQDMFAGFVDALNRRQREISRVKGGRAKKGAESDEGGESSRSSKRVKKEGRKKSRKKEEGARKKKGASLEPIREEAKCEGEIIEPDVPLKREEKGGESPAPPGPGPMNQRKMEEKPQPEEPHGSTKADIEKPERDLPDPAQPQPPVTPQDFNGKIPTPVGFPSSGKSGVLTPGDPSVNNIQVPTMDPQPQEPAPVQEAPRQMSQEEMNWHFLQQLRSQTDPNKWKFIEEIKSLAEQQNNYQHSTMTAVIQNSQKSIQDLFYIKYDLSLNTLIVTDLLINFRDIRKCHIWSVYWSILLSI